MADDPTARAAAASAERLLADPYLNRVLDESIAAETLTAMTGASAEHRDRARFSALALTNLRQGFADTVQHWRDRQKIADAAKARE